jgi:hypothetical protein
MAQRKETIPDDGKSHRQRFIEAAREHGCDGDADDFRRAVHTIAKAPASKAKKAARNPKK